MPGLSDLLVRQAGREKAIPVTGVSKDGWKGAAEALPPARRAWAEANGFKGQPGRALPFPGEEGAVEAVLFGLGDPGKADPFLPGKLATLLPAGLYALEAGFPDVRLAAIAFLLEAYRFTRYLSAPEGGARLLAPDGVDAEEIARIADAAAMVRDLVNTPANDLGPDELEEAARSVANAGRAKLRTISGSRLAKDFPLIDAVGRGSPRAPRLVDFSWGDAKAPKVTIVGKGVCFDTGGLDIKPAAGMLLMKKDMGGAANALGLARMIMAAKLPVRLRVLVPMVENSVSGDSFRPGDVFRSRKGLTVEIGNTDAEGRLVLADALALADEEEPDLLVDLATLTGAARVALGPDLPAFYTDDDAFASLLSRHAMAENDPLWRLPFWRPYNSMFESKVADVNNAGSGGFAGSITAALFLLRFVERAKTYVHIDLFAWTPAAKPGRPAGGEAQAMRALFCAIRERYAGS